MCELTMDEYSRIYAKTDALCRVGGKHRGIDYTRWNRTYNRLVEEAVAQKRLGRIKATSV